MEPELIRREPLGNGFYVNVSSHHTFGTDAVLLSDFADGRKKDKLIDLGTGCGIIPLLMLRDQKLSEAVGVDISHEAATLAKMTADELGLDKFKVIESDLNELKGKTEFGCYSLVTCNPPYKAPGAGIKNPDGTAAAARHEIFCTLRNIISVSSKLLQTSGRLCMCHRPERLAELMRLMSEYGIEPKRMRLVCQRKGEEPWLCLVEGKKSAHIGLRVSPTLYVEENGEFSEEMIKIYGAYKEAYLG